MNTKEGLNAIKEDAETLNSKPHELTDEELEQVNGGVVPSSVSCTIDSNTREILVYESNAGTFPCVDER